MLFCCDRDPYRHGMALITPAPTSVARRATPRRLLLCAPTYFDVTYAINPWMVEAEPVDRRIAGEQWDTLRSTYESLGHAVEVIDAVPGLPDMVFAANAGLVVDGAVLPARFHHDERRGEEAPYRRWFDERGYRIVDDRGVVNEGEGDFLVAGDVVLAGSGFRTDPAARRLVEQAFGRPALPLELVDPRFYHLDTALTVLDERTIAFYPPAFAAESRRELLRWFPDAIIAGEADAMALGLNAFSDGANVVLAEGADQLVEQLAERGFAPHPVPMGEFRKAGGAVKCCTLELRS